MELGITELLVIFLFIILMFGPDKLPEIARTLGKYYAQLMKYKEYLDEEIRKGMLEVDEGDKKKNKKVDTESVDAKESKEDEKGRKDLEKSEESGESDQEVGNSE